MRVGMPTAVRESPRVRTGVMSGSHGARTPGATAVRIQLRPGRIVAFAWLLAGVPIAVLQLAHSGVHGRTELPPLLHWLRDTSLAVPVAAFALVIAVFVVVRAVPGGPNGRARLAATAGLGFAAAALFALLSVPLAQVHGALFGAELETGMTPVQHALTEGLAVFQVALLLVPVVLLTGVPWRDPQPDTTGPATEPPVDGGTR